MPIPLRKPQDDKALFFPRWDCFCCHDSGIVPDYLIRMIPSYEDYSGSTHKNVLCTCVAASRFSGMRDAFDNSLTRDQQAFFHQHCFDDWLATNKAIANGSTKRQELMGAISTFSKSL